MKKNTWSTLFAILVIASLLLAACGGGATAPAATTAPTEAMEEPTEAAEPTEAPTEAAEPTEAPTEAAAEPTEAATAEATTGAGGAAAGDIGTEANPIKVLFVPSVDANVITTGGEVMAEALEQATGLQFEVSVPTSYAATVEEVCASPEDTMVFLPANPYVLGNQLCGIDVAFKAVRRGWGVYWAAILVQRDSDIDELADLDGLKWAYPDAGSTSGYLFPRVMFQNAGIEPGETLEAGGHPAVVRAIYNGEADFGTTYFSAPAKPEGETPWAVGDDPDIPADLIESCGVVEDELRCGEWVVLDARQTLREEAPDVVQQVRILALTDPIPNDTLAFGPDFPAELRAQIEEALLAFAQTEDWANSIGSEDFYGWSGLEPATDEEYDVVRQMVELAGITLENLGQ